MSGAAARLAGVACFATRSGYTGEDGFEISVAAEDAEARRAALLAEPEVAPAGLGARDTLRLEAGLCLYGHDIDTTTTPVEAALTWAIQKVRRAERRPRRRLSRARRRSTASSPRARATQSGVGLLGLERAPVREGASLVDASGAAVGRSPAARSGRASARRSPWPTCASEHAAIGTLVHADVRGKHLPMRVAALPFAPHRYFRG